MIMQPEVYALAAIDTLITKGNVQNARRTAMSDDWYEWYGYTPALLQVPEQAKEKEIDNGS
jgi:hypothetical protein